MKDWVPLFSKLVWPVLLLLAVIVFNKQAGEVYSEVIRAIKEGRGVKIGSFLELSERAKATNIQELAGSKVTLDAVRGPSAEVVKGSMGLLQQLKTQLQRSPNQRIEVLKIVDGPRYSAKVIEQYITTLGVRYVVFERQGQFDGWIDAGVFLAQLTSEDRQRSGPGQEFPYEYSQIRSIVTGVTTDSVPPDTSAKDVLERMQEKHVDRMAVVSGDKKFKFIVEREDILGKLMTSLLLEQKPTTP